VRGRCGLRSELFDHSIAIVVTVYIQVSIRARLLLVRNCAAMDRKTSQVVVITMATLCLLLSPAALAAPADDMTADEVMMMMLYNSILCRCYFCPLRCQNRSFVCQPNRVAKTAGSILGLTPRIPRTVHRYFWAYPFLLFSFSFFSHYIVVILIGLASVHVMMYFTAIYVAVWSFSFCF